MWIRLLSRHGNSTTVTMPSAILQDLEWNQGDFVRVTVKGKNDVRIERVDVSKLSDRQIRLTAPLRRIKYGK